MRQRAPYAGGRFCGACGLRRRHESEGRISSGRCLRPPEAVPHIKHAPPVWDHLLEVVHITHNADTPGQKFWKYRHATQYVGAHAQTPGCRVPVRVEPRFRRVPDNPPRSSGTAPATARVGSTVCSCFPHRRCASRHPPPQQGPILRALGSKPFKSSANCPGRSRQSSSTAWGYRLYGPAAPHWSASGRGRRPAEHARG